MSENRKPLPPLSPETTKHKLAFLHASFRADCECGWASNEQPTRRIAMAEFRAHVVECKAKKSKR